MKMNLLLDFTNVNDANQLSDFYSRLYDKLQELNKRRTRLSFYFLISVITYFISSKSIIPSIQIGPVSLNDTTLIFKFLPVVFAYLMYDFTIISDQQTDVFSAVKIISKKVYNYPENAKPSDLKENDFFTRLILPVSISNVLSKLNSENKISWFTIIMLLIPVFVIAAFPVYFEYMALKNLYFNYFQGTMSKICFFVSIYLILVSLYLNLKLMSHYIKDQKADLGI